MTVEEIEQSLKTMAEGQARMEATFQDVAQLHQQVLRNHETRHSDFEESFRKVAIAIENLTQLAITTDGRLNSPDESHVHTDARLDSLIDAQIQMTQRFDRMSERGDRLTENVKQLGIHLDQVTENVRQLTVDSCSQ
ncbi:MAG: hypothetical protein L0220_35635 [Acidobacteria bacterium]|nr:hypothetical protein [Acidobacteriota bacterium]